MSFNASINDVAEYWNRRPCNIRHSPEPVGTKEYYEQVRARKYTVEPHIPAFAQFNRWKDKWVIEVGCGIGTDAIEFALAGAFVTAIDLSERSLEIAKHRAEVYGVSDRMEFRQQNAEHVASIALDWAPDLIYSFGVLHHTPHPERAFASIASLANPTTAVKLMLYNRASTKALRLTKGLLWDDAAIARQSEAQTGCPVTYTYWPWSIREELEPYFRVDQVTVDHIFPYKLNSYLQYKYEKAWWAKLPGFRIAEQLVGWHLLIDAHGKG